MLIKKSVILMLALLLSACGYHLRGALHLPAGLKNVYLEGGSAELRGQFKRAMDISSVPLASSPETAGIIVKIFDEDSQRRVLSLNSAGTANDFELGYRFDYKGRSAVISGDTLPGESLRHQARGVDLLLHEAFHGLAGALFVRDKEEEKLELPAGEFEIPIVIQDRLFDQQNQLIYVRNMHDRMMGFYGDRILVNGRPDYKIDVASRAYRLRVLNGSTARIYKLGWDDGSPITVIGVDGGLLEKPEVKPYVMLAPGERLDVWADFSGRNEGSQLVMRSLSFSGVLPKMAERMMQGGRGGMGGMMHANALPVGSDYPIFTVRVTKKVSDSPKLPPQLSKIDWHPISATANPNKPVPIGISEGPMAMLLNGRPYAYNDIQDFERIKLNTIQLMEIFHAHGGGGGHGKESAPATGEHGAEKQSGGMEGMGHQGGGMGMMGGMKHGDDDQKGAGQGMGGMMGMGHQGGGMGMMGGMKHGDDDQKGGGQGMGGMGMMGGMKHGDDNQKGGGQGMGGMMGMGGGMGGMGGMGMMMSMAHPIHLHGQQFQIVSRSISGDEEADYATVREGFIESGLKDTVLVMPGERVRIIKPFQDFKGLFMYHCHNLEHEDMGMMRDFLVE